MKIESISIKNFRIFDEITVFLDDYNAIVGENGAGKSTILAALNVFFRETQDSATSVTSLSDEDFHNKDTSKQIEITVTFANLSKEAALDFHSYVRQKKLVITAAAKWNAAAKRAEVKQFGQRLVMADFKEFFEAEKAGKVVADLHPIFANIRDKYPVLANATTKKAMITELRSFEEQNGDMCSLERSEDNFYGFTKGSDKLKKYVNWVYIPAVKDAYSESTESRRSALGELLRLTVRSKVNFSEKIEKLRDRTREEYQQLLADNQKALDDVSSAISSRLSNLAHPSASARLKWTEEEGRSVVVNDPIARVFAEESGFSGEVARFGHGFQRCYLISLLQELAESGLVETPTLILGMEEPELYQHPPQARHLSDVLHTLSAGNSQVLVTTHSPYFISGHHFENVRLVRRSTPGMSSTVDAVTYEQVASALAKACDSQPLPPSAEQARMHQALNPQINEMFFCSKAIFVEGIEDEALLKAWLVCLNKWEMIRERRAHIIPVHNKSNLIRPVVLSKLLKLPCLVIFDSDGAETNLDKRAAHERDNSSILRALGLDSAPFPTESYWGGNVVQWSTDFQTELKAEIDQSNWDKAFGEARKALGNPSGNFRKNPILLGQMVAELYRNGVVPNVIEKLSENIESFLSA